MAQLVKALAGKPDNLRWPLEPTQWEERTDPSKLFSDLHTQAVTSANTHHQSISVKQSINKEVTNNLINQC